jgi:hypothetical protein
MERGSMTDTAMVTNDAGNGLVTGLKVTATILALGVLVQAWLGSTGMFQGEPGRIDVHAMVGNGLFLVTVIQAVIAMLMVQKRLASRTVLLLTVATILLTTAQIGLGYSTRDSVDALAWHLPTGVALMGLTTVIAVLAFQVRPRDV